jgi:hypothetical protein
MLGLSIARDGKGQQEVASPVERYQALLKDYQDASSGRVRSDEERARFIGGSFKVRNRLALEFVKLAEEYPNDPVALDALIQAVWQVNTTPWPADAVGKDEARPKAFALLERNHITSDKLGTVCQRVSYGFCKEYETFLRTVLEKNPHKNVLAEACLALAHFLSNRLHRLDLIDVQPELGNEFADLFGKDYLDELQRQDQAKVLTEVEALLERAAKDYGDLRVPDGKTVGEKATAELFEIRHLTVGKEAPDIEGQDQNGQPLKLSDYRGKVVLLDFWHEL